MISETEKIELGKELKKFKEGLKSHIDALQAYCDIWAKDNNNPFALQPNFEERVYDLIITEYLGEKDTFIPDEKISTFHLVRSILKRFYKKITNKK